MALKQIEIRPAYAWDCEECGRENFSRAIVPEFSAEEEAEIRQELGVEPWDTGQLLMCPEEVECAFCRTRFETLDTRGDPVDED